MYQEMFSFVKEKLNDGSASELTKSGKTFVFRSRYEHTKRVFIWAKRLLQYESADEAKVLIAAVLHDVGRSISRENHAAHSAVICEQYLKEQGYSESFAGEICELVANHSKKSLPAEGLSPELKVLMDADWLDETGALSALWDVLDEGRNENCTYTSAYERLCITLISLEKHCGCQKTETGRRWYQESVDHLRSFTQTLRFELGVDEEV